MTEAVYPNREGNFSSTLRFGGRTSSLEISAGRGAIFQVFVPKKNGSGKELKDMTAQVLARNPTGYVLATGNTELADRLKKSWDTHRYMKTLRTVVVPYNEVYKATPID